MPTIKTIQEWIEWAEEIESSCENGDSVYQMRLCKEEEYNQLLNKFNKSQTQFDKLKSASDDTLATLEKENLELKEENEKLNSFVEVLKAKDSEMGKENEKLKDRLEVLIAQGNKIDNLIKLRSK